MAPADKDINYPDKTGSKDESNVLAKAPIFSLL